MESFLFNEGVPEGLERIRQAVTSILEVKNVLLPQLTEIPLLTNHKTLGSVFTDPAKACNAQGISFCLE